MGIIIGDNYRDPFPASLLSTREMITSIDSAFHCENPSHLALPAKDILWGLCPQPARRRPG